MAIDLAGRADSIWPKFTEFGASDSAALNGKGNNSMLDPATTSALIDGGSKVLGSLLGGGGAPPSAANSSATQYVQFSTGTNTVATSGSKATSDTGFPWYVWVIGALVVIKIFKKSKG